MSKERRPEGLQAWSDLCEMVDKVRVLLNRQLQAEVGLTLAENLVLCQVAMAPGQRLKMVDVASRLGVAKSAVTKTVDRLEQRGLLARQHEPEDRRVVYAAITELGLEVFKRARPAYLRAVNEHFAALLDRSTLGLLSEASASVIGALGIP